MARMLLFSIILIISTDGVGATEGSRLGPVPLDAKDEAGLSLEWDR